MTLNPSFSKEVEEWDKSERKTFTVGSPSKPLKSIGVRDRKIIWHSGKISDILHAHKDMTREIIKQIPDILENPVIVLKSSTQPDTSIVIYGETFDASSRPVMVALNLCPKIDDVKVMDLNLITSVYGRRNTANFIEKSEVLYIDPDKERADSWFQGVGVQFPSDKTNYGPIGKITYSGEKVNSSGILFSQLGQNHPNQAF